MSMALVALLFLLGAIVLGFVKKSNVGLICLGLTVILGRLGNIPLGKMYGGFPGKLFLTLLGTMFFFSLLQENGTLEKASKKLTRLCGTKVFLVPIVIYLVSYILSAIGPGAISVQTVMVLFAVPLAFQLGVSPILMGVMAILGAVGGTASPIALTGIIVGDLLSEMNVAMPGNAIFLGVTAANVMCALVVYLLFKGWKLRGESTQSQEAIAFDGIQKFSLLLIAILFVAVVGFSQDVGFVCFCAADDGQGGREGGGEAAALEYVDPHLRHQRADEPGEAAGGYRFDGQGSGLLYEPIYGGSLYGDDRGYYVLVLQRQRSGVPHADSYGVQGGSQCRRGISYPDGGSHCVLGYCGGHQSHVHRRFPDYGRGGPGRTGKSGRSWFVC